MYVSLIFYPYLLLAINTLGSSLLQSFTKEQSGIDGMKLSGKSAITVCRINSTKISVMTVSKVSTTLEALKSFCY